MRKPVGTIVAAVAVLLVVLAGVLVVVKAPARPLALGDDAPSFRARTLADGAPAAKTLADYKGEVVLLNLWATWCGPCRVEMPSIERLHRRFAPQGLKVVAISVDAEGKEQAIRDFVRGMGLSFEILHDPTGKTEELYQVNGIPETYLIGRDGTLRKRVTGADEWDSPANLQLVASLLAEGTGRAPVVPPMPGDTAAALVVPAGGGR
jgi:peroxiredoxin